MQVNDREQVFGNQVLSENMNGKEKVSDTDVVEPICEEKTASSTEQMAPSSEHDVPQAKAKPVRRQTQSGPLSPAILSTNTDSPKVHGYARFAI